MDRVLSERMKAILLDGYQVPGITAHEKCDEFILEWMADVYTYMQWKYKMNSCKIAVKIKPEELYLRYSPLHEAGLETGVDKLKDIYQL